MTNREYIQAEFNKLEKGLDYNRHTMKICGGCCDGETHWLDITNQQLEQIKQILLQGAKDE